MLVEPLGGVVAADAQVLREGVRRGRRGRESSDAPPPSLGDPSRAQRAHGRGLAGAPAAEGEQARLELAQSLEDLDKQARRFEDKRDTLSARMASRLGLRGSIRAMWVRAIGHIPKWDEVAYDAAA